MMVPFGQAVSDARAALFRALELTESGPAPTWENATAYAMVHGETRAADTPEGFAWRFRRPPDAILESTRGDILMWHLTEREREVVPVDGVAVRMRVPVRRGGWWDPSDVEGSEFDILDHGFVMRLLET